MNKVNIHCRKINNISYFLTILQKKIIFINSVKDNVTYSGATKSERKSTMVILVQYNITYSEGYQIRKEIHYGNISSKPYSKLTVYDLSPNH
jgi:hypothetical protein